MNYKEECIRDFKEIIFKLNAMVDKINQMNGENDIVMLDNIFNLINETHLSANVKTSLKFVAMYNMNK